MWVSMWELESVLGRDMAKTLSRYRGGVEMYIPESSWHGAELKKIVGELGMIALVRQYGGKKITIPNGRREPQKGKILRLLKVPGKSRAEIAVECGVTERYVYMLGGLNDQRQSRRLSLLDCRVPPEVFQGENRDFTLK